MKTRIVLVSVLLSSSSAFFAQEKENDTTKIKKINEVFVSSTRANSNTPTTFTNISSEQIKKNNFGQDLPYLLEGTASTVVTSDAGAGVGYTGIRIRGVDPTRTNVTVNGIPMNDSESHGVWWVNMPDFASSVDNMQIQRGAGTSTNGAAAFGASINIQTDKLVRKPYAISDNSFGSFNTLRNTIKVGTGLMDNHFSFDIRLSKISSDGYIDRANANLRSYYFSGAYVGNKSTLRANVFSGKEITYQAWYGIPEAKLRGDATALDNHFYANYYPGGMYQDEADSVNLYKSDSRTYNIYTYDNETDNYRQDHYQLLYSYQFNPTFKMNLAGHYTKGYGYYEQYRKNDDFADYGLTPLIYGSDTITTTDLIRRRWLDNDFYGGIFSFEYKNYEKGLQVIFGGGMNQYKGNHFGEIIWARFAAESEIRDKYYDNNSNKKDANAYLKVLKTMNKLTVFADLQVRNIHYSFLGIEQVSGQLFDAQQQVNYTFFNPKAGLLYQLNKEQQLYASYARANREPVRDDFREKLSSNRPLHETLNDVEVGYRNASEKYFLRANGYLMAYKNQLILTGEINDVGGYTRTNVPSSYRAGFELETGIYLLDKKLALGMNLNVSQNKIKTFTEFIDNYDNYDSLGNMIQDQVVHSNTDIAFSPNIIAGITLSYQPVKSLSINLLSKHVGRQFLDNTSTESRSLNPYYITNLSISYTNTSLLKKELVFSVLVNNLFNYKYENNGYTWGYIAGGTRTVENFYFPQAGINWLGRVTLNF